MSKGFLVSGHDLFMAEHLAYNIKLTQSEVSDVSIMLPKRKKLDPRYRDVFDHVVRFDPLDDYRDECTAIYAMEATPYDETILVSPDMMFPTDITHWWNSLSRFELLCATDRFTYRNDPVDRDYNRDVIRQNRLPDLFANLMYFRKTESTQTIFSMAREIAKHWRVYRYDRLQGSIGMTPSDDPVMACAIKETGYTRETVRTDCPWFSFTDMVMQIQKVPHPDTIDDDWVGQLNSYIKEDGSLIVGQHLQVRPFRYYNAAFLTSPLTSILRRSHET